MTNKIKIQNYLKRKRIKYYYKQIMYTINTLGLSCNILQALSNNLIYITTTYYLHT